MPKLWRMIVKDEYDTSQYLIISDTKPEIAVDQEIAEAQVVSVIISEITLSYVSPEGYTVYCLD